MLKKIPPSDPGPDLQDQDSHRDHLVFDTPINAAANQIHQVQLLLSNEITADYSAVSSEHPHF